MHGCAAFKLAFYPQKSAVRLDKVFHDRQAESCAAQFTRARFINAVEALCQTRKVFLWDSTAGVGNRDFTEGGSGLSLAGSGGEGADGTSAGSLIRSPDGDDTNVTANDWAFTTTITPGAANQ